MSGKRLILIFGDQLFRHHPAISEGCEVLMVESLSECGRLPYHKFKLVYLLTCMREYRDELVEQGVSVNYRTLDQEVDFEEVIKEKLATGSFDQIHYVQPHNKYFRKRLEEIFSSLGFKESEKSPSLRSTPLSRGGLSSLSPLSKGDARRAEGFFKGKKVGLFIHNSPAFLTTVQEFDDYLTQSKTKNLLMNNFYIWERRRLDLLLDSDKKPLGGQWSFDGDNRKKLPKNQELPERLWRFESKHYVDVANLIEKYFLDNPGELNTDYSWLPLTFKQADKFLDQFLETSLGLFGDYEDAMTTRDDYVFHSVLSPMLNNGLLTPRYVLDKLLKFLETHPEVLEGNLNSVEGFIRQLVGWREWVKGLYEVKYDDNFKTLNYFEAKKKLPDYFYHPEKGGEELDNNIPLREALNKVLRIGWCHHIERLMILANWMTLQGYDPGECYDWFVSQFVDGYEWVMVANVMGMGLYADGGLFATKPYISGGNYIKKMSDYETGDWVDTWTAAYWDFLKKNYDKLKDNPRMGLVLGRVE
jgi:deoxyribodipyrimidine photolyase-related protein